MPIREVDLLKTNRVLRDGQGHEARIDSFLKERNQELFRERLESYSDSAGSE